MRILTLAWGGGTSRSLYEEVQRLQAELEEKESLVRVLRLAMDKVDLQHAKAVRNLTSHFLEALEEDDVQALRDGIEAGLSDLNDHVARLEEHSGL